MTSSPQNQQQMANQSNTVFNRPEEVPFHPKAADLISELGSSFSKSLIRYSQVIAFQRKDDLVLSNHVREAIDIIQRQEKKRKWKEYTIFLSSLIVGATIQSFLTELFKFQEQPSSGSVTATIIYVAISVVGIIIGTIAIIK